jgi:predicted restriction endonuclease
MARRIWTRDESIVAFNLYCQLPFGQLHSRNPQVAELAKLLDRSANSVAMKLVNFASLDPTHRTRGVSGLKNTSAMDQAVWDEFNSNWAELAAESELATRLLHEQRGIRGTDEGQLVEEGSEEEEVMGETEARREATVRLGQAFFRKVVLASYNERCCVCRLPVRSLLVASHIVPWAANAALRVNPCNGLCLCAFHDRAFDRGLITVEETFALRVSSVLREFASDAVVAASFLAFAGALLQLPEKFRPKDEYCAHHREHVFLGD